MEEITPLVNNGILYRLEVVTPSLAQNLTVSILPTESNYAVSYRVKSCSIHLYRLNEITPSVSGVNTYNMYIYRLEEITLLVTGVKSYSMFIYRASLILM